jgi:holin-like protein
MKFIYQLGVILSITFIGEVIYKLIPMPIPASIYGFIIMLLCLKTKIIKLERVRQAGYFLLETMPLMFIPAAVGLLNVWNVLNDILLPVILITLLTTVIVMAVTGKMTQFIILKGKSGEE